MLDNEYALIRLFTVTPTIEGRKRFQKTVYLLQQIGFPYAEKFKYYHYGPYSSELQAEIDRLVRYELINETYTGDAYVYEITEKGKEFIQQYSSLNSGSFELPEHLVKRIIETNTPVLEMASTYAYLLEMGYKEEEAMVKASELKPHLEYCLDKARTLYEDICRDMSN